MNRWSCPVRAAVLLFSFVSAGCGGGGGGGSTPTSPTPPADYVITLNSTFYGDVQGIFTQNFDVRVDFDGSAATGSQKTEIGPGTWGIVARFGNVGPGRHRVSIVLTRQARNPADYRYTGAYSVFEAGTGAKVRGQDFDVRARVSTGSSLNLEIVVP